jgi:hypothetical protein
MIWHFRESPESLLRKTLIALLAARSFLALLRDLQLMRLAFSGSEAF